jgi:hypothetical protein
LFGAGWGVARARLCDPNETCRREGCVPPEIDPEDLPDFDPGQDFDASLPNPDASADAAAPADAAPGLDAEIDAPVAPAEVVLPFLPEGMPIRPLARCSCCPTAP